MVPNAKTDRFVDARDDLDATDAPQARLLDISPGADAVESPARRLQLELERSWPTEAPVERWSKRRSMSFILFTNTLLWVTLIWGVVKIV